MKSLIIEHDDNGYYVTSKTPEFYDQDLLYKVAFLQTLIMEEFARFVIQKCNLDCVKIEGDKIYFASKEQAQETLDFMDGYILMGKLTGDLV